MHKMDDRYNNKTPKSLKSIQFKRNYLISYIAAANENCNLYKSNNFHLTLTCQIHYLSIALRCFHVTIVTKLNVLSLFPQNIDACFPTSGVL